MQFIVAGGVAAVFQGAPITTLDVEVVHLRDAANVERLLQVLKSLDAYYRFPAERRLRPNASYLLSPGFHLLMTPHGPFDLLGEIGDRLSYEDLIAHSSEMQISGERRIRVLDLPTLIQVKEYAGRDKDKAVLNILKRTLELQRGQH